MGIFIISFPFFFFAFLNTFQNRMLHLQSYRDNTEIRQGKINKYRGFTKREQGKRISIRYLDTVNTE